MITQQLIQTYQLSFVNKQIQANPDPNYYYLKFPETFHYLLTEFLYVWNDSSDIDEILIPKLEGILNGVIEKGDSGANSIYIDVTQTETDFYAEDSELPDFTIPTQDFYDILVLWRNFLNEAPLDGSKVGDSNVSA